MGMAASQARYLALVARKSNCEYEGQQINQSRLTLSNQSADLFNQLMALEVPKTPNQSDYTYTTYTYSDGDYDYTIERWNHLSDSEGEGYNYAVTYTYEKEDNIGFQKYKLDPQVLFSQKAPSQTDDPAVEIMKIEMALQTIDSLYEAAKTAEEAKNDALAKARNRTNYKDKSTFPTVTTKKSETTDTEYSVIPSGGGDPSTYLRYDTLDPTTQAKIKDVVDKLKSDQYGVFTNEDFGSDYLEIFYNSDTDSIAFLHDLQALENPIAPTALPVYHVSDASLVPSGVDVYTMEELLHDVDVKTAQYNSAILAYNDASEEIYERYNVPSQLGNIKLEPISKVDMMDQNTAATIQKIIKEMKEEEIDNNIVKSFNTLTGEYNADTYIGGLYKYNQAASTYYVSYYDLFNSVVNGSGINNIDNQKKLPYYGTVDTEVEVENTSRALIEKDKSGRFKTIKLEDDSQVYELKAQTEIDQVAYQDAMNEATYQKALYDKKVQDINAKTSLIHKQDQELELRLKQLDTEQNALNTEIDAVAKVVKDNVEKSFKTFSG